MFGTGSNDFIFHRQQEIYQRLPRAIKSRAKLVQLPIRFRSDASDLPEGQPLRSRGFVFLLLGAVCALLEGRRALYVYESGVGAINLAFRASEVGLDHARSVHPLSLIRMAEFIERVLGQPFHFINPFLFWTKADMCQVFQVHNLLELAFRTISCDRRYRCQQATQCGRCSSCLLRRQAFAALGIEDKTAYVFPDFSLHALWTAHKNNHLPAMLYQVETLETLLAAENPWQSLVSEFDTLSLDVVDQLVARQEGDVVTLQAQTVGLYRRYVDEWTRILAALRLQALS